ncbi:unnamed protein product [Lactuca virosa]|uniref:Uncharacterized protein n=1 Tax=Lactuca virosa TaxID=75947 RepID=A0AAU9MPK2_9ASTR|nr:unnamed protein product [Lactuca virosa]
MEILPELLADVYRLSLHLKFEILLSMESLHPNEVVALSPSPFFFVSSTIKKMSLNKEQMDKGCQGASSPPFVDFTTYPMSACLLLPVSLALFLYLHTDRYPELSYLLWLWFKKQYPMIFVTFSSENENIQGDEPVNDPEIIDGIVEI